MLRARIVHYHSLDTYWLFIEGVTSPRAFRTRSAARNYHKAINAALAGGMEPYATLLGRAQRGMR